jgi:hypothetical protein
MRPVTHWPGADRQTASYSPDVPMIAAPAKVAVFLIALTAIFGVAYLTGTQSSALLAAPPVSAHGQHSTTFGGLSATANGYTMRLPDSTGRPGNDQFVELQITGPDGRSVPDYTETDGAPMHVIAIRQDLTGYQHLYPEQGDGASWWAVLNLTPGPWRLIAEFRPAALGQAVALGADLTISGNYRPRPLPDVSERDRVDGYVATLSQPLTTSSSAPTVVTLSTKGRPVTDLTRAHGSLGHGVLIRPTDLGYWHLHADPVDETYRGPDISFTGGAPEPGTYRMFTEFTRGEDSHVAAFTVVVTS